MSNWKTIGCKLKTDEYDEIIAFINSYNKTKNTDITVSIFIKKLLLNVVRKNKG